MGAILGIAFAIIIVSLLLAVLGVIVLPIVGVIIVVGVVLAIVGIIFRMVFSLPMLFIIGMLAYLYYSKKNKR